MFCSSDVKPKVECSLVTEFQDHIFVAVDAESFFFLHDMIASYVKDTKEKMVRLEGGLEPCDFTFISKLFFHGSEYFLSMCPHKKKVTI